MKCLYIKTLKFDNSFIGGARSHTIGMVNGFSDANEDVEFLTENILSDVKAPQLKLFNEAVNKKYDKHVYKKTLDYLYNDVNNRPDYIYSRFSPYALASAKLSLKTGVPLVTEFNSSTMTTWREVSLPRLKKSKNILKRILAPILAPAYCYIIGRKEMFILNTAKIVVTVSNVLKEELIVRGVPENKILVCPNGVDPSVFYYKKNAAIELRKDLHISKDCILVGFSGTFGKWHGIPEMAEAIKKINNSNIHFLLIGEGIMSEYIKNELKDNKNVTFINNISFSNMPQYLSACDILLITNSWKPSDKRKFFGSPTKMFEYMATERAIIASNLEQIGDIMEENKNCVKFEPGDVDGLISKIIELSYDKKKRDALGRQARIDVIEKYTWKQNADKIVEKITKGSN